MMKKFVYLIIFLVAVFETVTTALQPLTENNHVLGGHVFKWLYATDWLNCIQACHDEPRCISYNYQRSAAANGLCELNDCGVEERDGARDKLLIYSPGFVFQQIRERKCYKSCEDIQRNNPGAMSGVYKIYPLSNAEPIEVYCELDIAGGGFSFLPRSLTLRSDAQQIINDLFNDKKNVLLKLQKNVDGSEAYTLIQPHPIYININFGVLVNSYSGYTGPINAFMKDYIFLGILPKSVAQQRNLQGFKSNEQIIEFNNCNRREKPNGLFAFLPNHNGQTPSNHAVRSEYEDSGIAVDWRLTAKPITPSDHVMPNKFFFLTEVHFGGCGCYTSSDRWKKYGYNATAIGIR